MNPLALHARNYRCFETLDLDFPDGCVAIIGENGAGKSSIVNAIDLAIFGPESRSLADALSDTSDGGELLLELELEHAHELYRVRRSFSAKGRGKTTLDFERAVIRDFAAEWPNDPDSWTPLTRSSAKETQELIEQTLGLSRETFRASAFLQQGDGAAFTEAQPRDRKRILAQVLGLDRYDDLQARAKSERVGLQEQHQELTGRIRAAEETAAGRDAIERDARECDEQLVDLADQVADLEREHEDLTERFQAARAQTAQRQALEAELREAQTRCSQLKQQQETAARAAIETGHANAELAALPAETDTGPLEAHGASLVEAVQQYQRLKVERDAVSREADQATARIADLAARAADREQAAKLLTDQVGRIEAGAVEICPTCAQTLGADARAKTIETLAKQAAAAVDEANQLRREVAAVVVPVVPAEPQPPDLAGLEQVRDQLRAIRDAATRRAQLEERIRQNTTAAADAPDHALIASAVEDVEAKQRALASLEVADLDEIARQGTVAKERLAAARAAVLARQASRARLEERLAQIDKADRQRAETMTLRDGVEQQVNVVFMLERAFGRDGIPALIVENTAIPYLEAEANRVLAELGTSFQVELRTQAELKSGDGLRDTLDVVVSTETGERAYETFSGGERTRINLALRIALARLLAHRRGAESRLLAIDEPEFLDEAGTAALVNVLDGLRADFDKLYIVSHMPSLRDSFDTTLSVVRDGEFSRVEGDLQAVAA